MPRLQFAGEIKISSESCGPRCTPVEAVVHSRLNDANVLGRMDERCWACGARDCDIRAIKGDIVVFDFGRPIGRKTPFDTKTYDPTGAIGAGGSIVKERAAPGCAGTE